MSSTTPDTVASLTTAHVLPRVNLLPPEVHQARKLRRLQAGLGAGVALVAVAIGAFYLLESRSEHDAAAQLAAVKATGVTLQAKKNQYLEVPKTLSAIQAAEDARQVAMTNDVAWYRYLNDLSYITPANTWLNQMTITVNGASGSSTGSASAPTSTGSTTLATPGIATIQFQGIAKVHNNVAAWLDNIAKEKGWADAFFTNSTVGVVGDTKIVTFTSSATVTSGALSHRYDRKDG